MIVQQKVTPSGCQQWRRRVLAATSTKLAYASTLSVCIYDLQSQILDSIFTHEDVAISCISWESTQQKLLAVGLMNKKVFIWDSELQETLTSITGNSNAFSIDWHKSDPHQIAIVQENGDVRLVDRRAGVGEKLDWTGGKPALNGLEFLQATNAQFCHKTQYILAIGTVSGDLAFYDIRTTEVQILPHKEKRAALVDLAWDQGENNVLAAFSDGSVLLASYAKEGSMILNTFQTGAKAGNSLLWLNDKSGDFVTSNKKSATLKLWNASQEKSLQGTKVANVIGLHTSCFIDPTQVAFADTQGKVIVYNLKKKSTVFEIEAGHAETIFDAKICQGNKNVLGSVSFDGTIRLWNTQTMKIEAVIDSRHNSPLQPNSKNIIYCLTWHPSQPYFAVSCSTGYILLFDAKKQKLLSHQQIYPDKSSFVLEWNQANPKYIAMGSAGKAALVFEVDQQMKLHLYKNLQHRDSVYGVSWRNNILATAGMDGFLRVFDINSPEAKPIYEIHAHEKRIFQVLFNQYLQNQSVIATGSDDLLIKIYELSDLNKVKTLEGHQHNVRGMAFCPELPYLLVSGSWDGQIRVWDCRSCKCLAVLKEHQADVYGISFHRELPFTFVSCSRDTTIRQWQIETLVSQIKLNLSACPATLKAFDSADESWNSKPGDLRVYSNTAKTLQQQFMTQNKFQQFQAFRKIQEFCSVKEGQKELFDMIDFLMSDDPQPCENARLLHVSQTVEQTVKSAVGLQQQSAMQLLGSQYSKKEDRLRAIADKYLKAGEIKQYCETLVLLGDFETALASAPMVSMEFWQEIADKYASAAEGEEQVEACILASQYDKAIDLCKEREEFEDGKVLAAMTLIGGLTDTRQKYKLNQAPPDTSRYREETKNSKHQPFHEDLELRTIAIEESEKYFFQNLPLLSAASRLSVNDFKGALQYLIRANELPLALFFAKTFVPEAVQQIVHVLIEKAEKYFMIDTCLELLKLTEDSAFRQIFLHRVYKLGLLKKPANYDSIKADFSLKAQTENIEESVSYLILSDQLPTALEKVNRFLYELLNSIKLNAESDHSRVVQAYKVIEIVQSVTLSTKDPQEKSKFLAFSGFFACFKALFLGLGEILNFESEQALDIAETIGLQDLFVLLGQMNQQVQAKLLTKVEFNMSSQYREPYCDFEVKFKNQAEQTAYQLLLQGTKAYMRETNRIFDEPGVYIHLVQGTASLKGQKTSLMSKAPIKSQAYCLEDGKTYIALEEALEWALVNRMSPLRQGQRLVPW